MARQNLSADKITNALIELMNKKDYASISISDITSEADVSRISFYRNFSTKEDILRRFIDRVVHEIEASAAKLTCPGIFEYFLLLFQGIARYSEVVKEIYNANLGGIMLDRFNEKLFKTPLQKKDIDFDAWNYQRKFYTGAFYNVLIEWIINGMKESPENMANTCRALTGI